MIDTLTADEREEIRDAAPFASTEKLLRLYDAARLRAAKAEHASEFSYGTAQRNRADAAESLLREAVALLGEAFIHSDVRLLAGWTERYLELRKVKS